MPALFEAYVTNLGKYNEGELVGEYLKFPTTPEEVQALLKRIGIDGVRYRSGRRPHMEDPVPVKEEYTYQVGKIQFIVTPVYKDKGESMRDILLKLMLADLEPAYTDATTITKRMVAELIQYIEVYPAVKEDGITNQRVTIHYNCIGAFEVPDRRKIPERDILMETRKGVALSYAPTQIAM